VRAVKALHALLRRWRAEARAAEADAMEAHTAAARAAFAAYAGGKPLPPGTRPEVVTRWAQAEMAAVADAIKRQREHWETPCDKGGLGAPRGLEPMLRIFFEHAGRAIFASPDPPAAMRVFWEGRPRRGRPKEDNTERAKYERDLALAVAVQKRIYAAGATTNEKAIAEVADETEGPPLSFESVHKIYYRLREEACLILAWLALAESWRTGEEWDWSAFVEAPLPEPE
jgi:hypothetical protein